MRRVTWLLILWIVTSMLLSGCSISIRKASSDPSIASPTVSVPASVTPSPDPTSSAGTPTAIVAGPTPTVTPSPTADPTSQPVPTAPIVRPTTPAPQPTPRPTRPPVPTPTPVPATATPTPQPSGPPACANIPVRGFGLLWNSDVAVAHAVGCPAGGELGLNARVQVFANGYMIWLQTMSAGVDQSDWVITVIDGTAARYRVPTELSAWDETASTPTGAFKWVWDNVYTDQARLGDAVAPEYQTGGALQFYETGTMVWLKDPPGGGLPRILVVQANLVSASRGSAKLYPDRSYS